MERRHSVLKIAMMLVALSAVSFTAGALAKSAPKRGHSSEEVYKQLNPFVDALTLIQEKYVDEDKTKAKRLIEGSMQGMVATLDPFSQYMGADDFKEMQTETSGEFGGLGIEITNKDERLTVITPIDGTPASKAGVKAGDLILKINGEKTDGMTINEAVKRLRGKVGTEVTVTLFREGLVQPFDLTLTRAIIKIESVRSYRLSNDIAYVRVNEFIHGTADDTEKAIREMEKDAPLKGLILDLRNDPGGLLEEAVNTADLFAEKGKTIVSTKGRDPRQDYVFKATGRKKFSKRPIVLLVNGGSASGSEIVAGAIKDLKLGLLVGTKTFGKGSVQTIFPLENSGGAALRLTTAKYYTPSGVCIHGIGIEPDLEIKDPELTDSTLRAYTGRSVDGFAKQLIKEKMAVNESVKVTDEVMKRFYAFCEKKNPKVEAKELAKNAEELRLSLELELVAEGVGEKASRKQAVFRDKQVGIAQEIVLNRGRLTAKWAAHQEKVKQEKAKQEKEAKAKATASPTPSDGD
jgi:carboxyl-terminal processing protease